MWKIFTDGITDNGAQVRIDLDLMQSIPALSVDYAVMEHSQRIKVIPCDLGWSDLGSYDAFEEFHQEDSGANVFLQEDYTLFFLKRSLH